MKKSPYIPFAFLCLLSATSCIEEKLDPCPPQGGSVTVALRVEKFQARPPYRPSDFEQEFGKRIHSLDYLLYAGGQLVGQGRADDLHTASGGDYLFRIDTLPFGTYRLAFVANVTPRMMTGTMDAPEARYIVYQGEKNGDDHFRADVPFEVTCPCRNEFEAVLQRVHGITRFRFENIPARIASVEVVLDNVGQRMPLCGEPDLACEVSKRIPAAQLRTRPAGSFTLGTFCTLPGVRTSWRLRLYGEDDAPLYDRVVTDTLRIECNQLIDLTARFEEGDFRGEIEFSVDVDTTWDGANEGGGEIIRLHAACSLPAHPVRPGRCAYPGKDTAERPPTAANGIPGRDAPAADFISTGSRSAARSFRAHPLPSSAGSGRPVAWNRSPAPSCADRPPLRPSIRKGGRSARTRPAV